MVTPPEAMTSDHAFYATGGDAQGTVRHSFRTTNTVNAFPLSGGGDAKGGELRMPAMIRFWVEGGRIARLEEYLDTRQAMVLYATD